MYKPNTKKMLTVLIAAAMIFSALAILTFAATPAYAASGTIAADPTVFVETSGSGIVSTVVVFNGGTFGSGATLTFYVSASTSFASGARALLTTSPATVTLPAGTTTMSNLAITISGGSTVVTGAGTYYIAVSDDGGSTFTAPVTINAYSSSVINPEISVSPSTVTPNEQVTVSSVASHSFESSSTITLYLNYAGGSTLLSSVSESALASGVTLTIPTDLPGSASGLPYDIVAQESSSSSTYFGLTAFTTFNLEPTITVSPSSISGATTSTFTVNGYGFPASDSFAASTSASPTHTIYLSSTTYEGLVSSFTTSSAGSFTITVTGLTTALVPTSTAGVVDITMYDASGTEFSDVGTIIVSSPNPSALGFSFSVTATTGTTYNVNDSVAISVWNFPASTSVTFWLGPTEVGTGLTTDSNGAGSVTTVVPAIPGGSYLPEAVAASSDLSTSPTMGWTTAQTIQAFFQVVDTSGTAITASYGEYAPSSALFTVQAYGLLPTTSTYDFYDSLVAPSSGATGVGASGLVTSVSVGTESSTTGEFTPAANGTLIFTYSPDYAALSTPPSTSTIATITSANSVSAFDGHTYEYLAIGSATVTVEGSSTSYTILSNGATGETLSFSGLIPYDANLYPGVTNEYNVYMNNNELTLAFTPTGGTATSGISITTNDGSITFTVPTSNGLYNLNVTYNGQSVATASVGSLPVVVSSAGSSASSGTLMVVALTAGYEVVGYGYESSPALYYASYGATPTRVSSGETLTYGAFATSIAPSAQPAGTYAVFTIVSSSGTNYYVYSSYSVSANLTLSSYGGPSGTSITATTTGLVSTGYYNVYFATDLVLTETGSTLATGASFDVPSMAPGDYTVNVMPVGSTTVAASAGFVIKAPTSITLSLTPGDSTTTAFPGELISFTWTPGTNGYHAPSTTASSSPYYSPISVTVYLNNTAYTSITATYTSATELSGSFTMPNAAAGSYYMVSFGWSQTTYTTETAATTTEVSLSGYTGTHSAYLQLVSGSGALVVGVGNITAVIDTAIGSAMKVPLSELNAAVVKLNSTAAEITTSFGTMTSTLAAINATVAGIQSGQVLVQTDLGSIMTSFASLNASIATFNGDVATINTTLGQVKASLSSIGTQVTTNGNGIATITTDLGTLSGTVTSTSNGVSQIQTNLGDLNATVQTVKNQTSGFPTLEIFLIVIIVLVLITLVISFLAVSAANKAARKASEERKQ
ncbi:MAG: methyl-accepting chemotaxis protein [Candidatus Thermoplasmatota archaeon]|jgi:hypothetical protein|nr:methyl-accepting chemotaxis protein [Candidatus Thermoplasmatota archaeon]MCL5789211.1 methyl-accepting chemotaxis protein [Candidatus Thermoplasmatota archaeon]